MKKWCSIVVLVMSLLVCSCGKANESSSKAESPANTLSSARPSTGKVAPPDKTATPEQVLEIFLQCLQKGDTRTLCALFTDSSPHSVQKEALFAFYGPLAITNTHVEKDTTERSADPSGSSGDTAYMYMDFSSVDTCGEFGMTDGGAIDICKFPVLKKVNGVWKIETLGGSSPAR